MKIICYLFMLGVATFSLLASFRFMKSFAQIPAHDVVMKNHGFSDCFTTENFAVAFKYVQWKKQTAKKLSENQHVLFQEGYELQAIQNATEQQIRFLKDGYGIFVIDAKKGVISLSKMQQDEKFKTYQQQFCDLLEQAKLKNLPQNYIYQYADGNGNLWKISENKLEYIPISPEKSSSGVYSGGEPFEKAITFEQFQAIEILCKNALYQTDLHTENRTMGSGVVVQNIDEVGVARAFLLGDATTKVAIEQWLAQEKP